MLIFISNNLPWIWFGVLVICIIIEAITMSLTTIWAAIASIPFIFISKTALPIRWQFLLFAILTVVLIIFTRPFAIKKLKIGKENNTNINALTGQEVIVVEKITKFQKGLVKAKNNVKWNAVSVDESDIPKDTICIVQKVEGNTLFVKIS